MEFRSDDYYARNMNKVIFTRDTHEYSYLGSLEGKRIPIPHCIAETPGWCIVDELAELAADNYIIDKDRFGITFWKEWFNKKDWDVKSIMLCGFASDICVVSNVLVLRSQYPNLPITVRKDLCAGTSPELHEAAMKIMESCCIDIVDGGW